MSFFQKYITAVGKKWHEQRQRIVDRLSVRKDASDAIFGILVILLDSAVEVSQDAD